METTYTIPTIHLNGTGAKALGQEISNAYDALTTAKETLAKVTCHGRDFYPQGEEAITKAMQERAEMFAHLEAVQEYLDAWGMGIDHQTH